MSDIYAQLNAYISEHNPVRTIRYAALTPTKETTVTILPHLGLSMLGLFTKGDEAWDLFYFQCACGLEIRRGDLIMPLLLGPPVNLGRRRRVRVCSKEHAATLAKLLWGDTYVGTLGETFEFVS